MTSQAWSVSITSPVAVADYAPAATFGPRRLQDFEFVWLLYGSALWTVQDGEAPDAPNALLAHRLVPGVLALSRFGTIDSYHWDERQPSTHAYVHFRIEGDLEVKAPPAGRPLIRDLAGFPLLAAGCDHLVALSRVWSPAAHDRANRLLTLLLAEFLAGPPEQIAPPLPEAARTLIDPVRQIWRQDGVRAIGVTELAAAAGLSPGHLHRVFRRTYGCGPAHALELVRLSRAALALQRSNATLAEAAHRTGFANPYHFSRRFRSAYGLPPGAFRQTYAADAFKPVREAGLLALATALAGR